MSDQKNLYSNAGAQADQAWRQVRQYGELLDDAWLTVKSVAVMLGINRNHVKQIAVSPVMIDKRKYYRKGDIAKWIELDAAQPDGLLQRLRDKHALAAVRIAKEPSRRYSTSTLTADEAARAKLQTRAGTRNPFSLDEQSGGWSKRLAARRNSPILPPRPETEAEMGPPSSLGVGILSQPK